MRIVCPQCGFSRDVPSDKIPATSSMATCPKCKFRFRFRGHSQHAPQDEPEEPVYPPRPSRPVKGWEQPEEPVRSFEARSQKIYTADPERHHAPQRSQARWLPDPEPDPGAARESLSARLRPGMPIEPIASRDEAGVHEPDTPYPPVPAAPRPGRDAFRAEDLDAGFQTGARPPARDPHGRLGEHVEFAPRGQDPERHDGRSPNVPPGASVRHGAPDDFSGPVPQAGPRFAPDERPDEEPPYDPAPPPPREDLRAASRLHAREAAPREEAAFRPQDSEDQGFARTRGLNDREAVSEPQASIPPHFHEEPQAQAGQSLPARESAPDAMAWQRPEPEPAPPPPPPQPSFWDETEAQIGQSVAATAGDDQVRDIWARLQAMGGEAAQAPGAPRQGDAPRGGFAGIAADTVVPWEQLELYGAVPAFVNTVKNALVNPGDFFEQLPPSLGKVRPLLFANVVSVLSMIFMLVWFKFGLGPNLSDLGRTDGFQGLGAGTIGSLAWLGLSPILATAFVFLDAGLVHLLLGLLRSATRTFEDTFRAVCYAGSPWLFTLLPVPSSYLIPVIVIWHMTLQAIGLKKLHGAGYPQVLASVLVKWSLYLMASFAVLHVLITRR